MTAPPTEPHAYLAGIATAGLAAVCGAIFTSWLGAQGTLAGAMVGATIGSSVSEIVRAPLTSLERRIIQAGVSARQLRHDGLLKTVVTTPAAAQSVLGMVSRRSLMTVAVVALVGFSLAMGGVTAVEVASGEPLGSMVADQPVTGTTVGQVIPNPPPVLAPMTMTPTPAPTAQGPGAPLLPSARGGGGQPGLAASPTAEGTAPGGSDNSAEAPVRPVTGAVVGSPEAAAPATAATSGSPSTATTATSTIGTTTPGASPVTAAGPTMQAVATPTARSASETPAATSEARPGATASTPATPPSANAPSTAPSTTAPVMSQPAVTLTSVAPAGTQAATPTVLPTLTQTPSSGASSGTTAPTSTATPTPTMTATVTATPGPGTPAAP